MKKMIFKNKRAFYAITFCVVAGMAALSFQDTIPLPQQERKQEVDSIPRNRSHEKMTMKQFDRMIDEIGNGMEKMTAELKQLNIDKLQQKLDVDKLQKDIEQALSKIDIDKMQEEIQSSLKEIDMQELDLETSKEWKEAKKELEKAKVELSEIKTKELKKAMEEAKKEMQNAKEEFRKMDLDKILAEAKQSVADAKKEIQSLRNMFTEMEKDGLIDTKKGFKIEYKNKTLFVNGQKQPDAVAEKYSHYIKEDPFEIEIEKE